MSKGSILVVDDEPVILSTVAELFGQEYTGVFLLREFYVPVPWPGFRIAWKEILRFASKKMSANDSDSGLSD